MVSAKASSGAITLKFDEVKGAKKYVIYRKTTGDWKKIASFYADFDYYKDTGVKKGVKYTYTVMALRDKTKSVYGTNTISATAK